MQIQVYANTIRRGKNHIQLIEFFPGYLEALASIAEMELVNECRNPYVYSLACELPAVRQAREDEIFMTRDQELDLGFDVEGFLYGDQD